MLKIGSTTINATYLGATEIKKVYLGSTLVLDNSFVTLEGFESISGNVPNSDWVWVHEGTVEPTLTTTDLIEAGVPEGSYACRFTYTPSDSELAQISAGGETTSTTIDLSGYSYLAVDVFFDSAGDDDVAYLAVADADDSDYIAQEQAYDGGDGVTITLDLSTKPTRTDVVVAVGVVYDNDFGVQRKIDFDNLRGIP